MDEKELQEIKEQAARDCWDLAHANQRFSGKRYWAVTLNLTENTVPRLVAEVEELRAEQEHWQSNIQSLKEEFSARITEVEERLKGIEASRAVMREVLEDVRRWLGSLNIGESLSKIDLALSGSTVGNSDSRQAMK